MSWRDAVDTALDAGRGTPTLEGPSGSTAEVDIRQAGPIGARVRRVRFRSSRDRDVTREAERLTQELRALGGPVHADEVDADLGGARLRSDVDEDRGFHEVSLDGPRNVEVRRWTVGKDGTRETADLDLTRRDLGRLLDQLDG